MDKNCLMRLTTIAKLVSLVTSRDDGSLPVQVNTTLVHTRDRTCSKPAPLTGDNRHGESDPRLWNGSDENIQPRASRILPE
jgi:hypothetical protein